MKTIKGDLVLTKDTTFDESIKVEGDIKGYFNLKVIGNIACRNIACWDIDCRDIDCRDIIYCETVKVKAGCKIKAKAVIRNRSKLPIKEWKHVTI